MKLKALSQSEKQSQLRWLNNIAASPKATEKTRKAARVLAEALRSIYEN